MQFVAEWRALISGVALRRNKTKPIIQVKHIEHCEMQLFSSTTNFLNFEHENSYFS